MMMAVLNLLTGGVLDRVLGHFERQENARRDSLSEERKQMYADAADRRATAKEVRVATAGFWEMRLLTFWVLLLFVIHLTAIWADTMFGFPWVVEKLPSPIDEYEWQIILSLFGLGVANRAITAVAATATIIAKNRK